MDNLNNYYFAQENNHLNGGCQIVASTFHNGLSANNENQV